MMWLGVAQGVLSILIGAGTVRATQGGRRVMGYALIAIGAVITLGSALGWIRK